MTAAARRAALLIPATTLSLAISLAPAAASAELPPATEPRVHPTAAWLVTQLVPSPELVLAKGRAAFGVRWQITPLLYSFGIHRRLSPWRSLVAEPIVRHAGSVELFVSPEYLAGAAPFGPGLVGRAGVRAYFPLLHRGEYLSWSVGGAALVARPGVGMAYEAGVHVLFGVFGLVVSHAPTEAFRATTISLDVRYF